MAWAVISAEDFTATAPRHALAHMLGREGFSGRRRHVLGVEYMIEWQARVRLGRLCEGDQL